MSRSAIETGGMIATICFLGICFTVVFSTLRIHNDISKLEKVIMSMHNTQHEQNKVVLLKSELKLPDVTAIILKMHKWRDEKSPTIQEFNGVQDFLYWLNEDVGKK